MTTLVTITDDDYLLGTAVMLESLFSTYSESIDGLYVVYDKQRLSEQSKDKLRRFIGDKVSSVNFVHSDKYELAKETLNEYYKEDFRVKNWNSSIFLQVFLADAVPDSIDRVIYVDSDTIFTNDPAEFLALSPRLPMMAQLDYGVGTQWEHHSTPYFNAGVYITDLSYWRAIGIAESFLALTDFSKYQFHGQDFLNEKFRNNWQPLGPQVNVARECLSLEESISNSGIMRPENFVFHGRPILVHFFGSPKPWKQDYVDTIADNWRAGGYLHWVDYRYLDILNNIKHLI